MSENVVQAYRGNYLARETRWEARRRTLTRRNARHLKTVRVTAHLDLDALAHEVSGKRSAVSR